MTGPPYPRYAAGTGPGQNAIGSFIIGVSPIGDIPPFDEWTTVISEYANSPILTQLITNMAQYVDPTANFDEFFDTIWNVDTAIGVGLDIWGRIVGVQRVLQLPGGNTDYLGFEEAGSWQPFGQAPFYSGAPVSNNYTLSDDAFRTLIFAKALANICDGSIPAINQILLNLFPGQGNCYVRDNQNLTMAYVFEFQLSPVEYAIVANSGVMPRTSGCSVTIVQGVPR
jgi:hypothetical protein